MSMAKGVNRKPHRNVVLASLAFCFAMGSGASAFALPPVRTGGRDFSATPAECKAVDEATDKLFSVPHRLYMTETAGFTNGKPRQSELIFVGGVSYVHVSNKWIKSPVTAQEQREQQEKNRSTAKNQSCRHLRDESVNGEAAVVYAAHAENQGTVADVQVWISRSRGLVLKQEEDFGEVGAKNKKHISIRYEYGNIQAPEM
jgi:hypothetical protein